ncbi:MAG: hypothetical protein QM703_16565 [Gemmatales bacterium]
MRPERLISLFGFLAGLLALGMAAIAFSTGVTQEYFESSHPATEYAAKLVSQAEMLRLVFTLDNFFLLAYGCFFLWYMVDRKGKVDHWLLIVMGVFLLAAMVLDAIENFHILGMLIRAEQKLPITDSEIGLQYILSAVKFMVAYFAVIILGLTFPRDTALARFVGTSTAILFPILGVLAFTVPPPWVMYCGIGRSLFFVLGFILSAVVYWNRGEPK